MGIKPGQNTGNQGGIYQQINTVGNPVSNYVTVPDNKPMPPTTKPGHTWKPVAITPNSRR